MELELLWGVVTARQWVAWWGSELEALREARRARQWVQWWGGERQMGLTLVKTLALKLDRELVIVSAEWWVLRRVVARAGPADAPTPDGAFDRRKSR